MTRIVVGVDGSDGGRAALEWALHYAQATNAEIDAVLAYDPELVWIDIGSDYETLWRQYAGERGSTELQDSINEVAATSGLIRQHVVEAAPATALVDAAT